MAVSTNVLSPRLEGVLTVLKNALSEYFHLYNKRTGRNKRVLTGEFFCYYMKKRLLLHRNKHEGGQNLKNQ